MTKTGKKARMKKEKTESPEQMNRALIYAQECMGKDCVIEKGVEKI